MTVSGQPGLFQRENRYQKTKNKTKHPDVTISWSNAKWLALKQATRTKQVIFMYLGMHAHTYSKGRVHEFESKRGIHGRGCRKGKGEE